MTDIAKETADAKSVSTSFKIEPALLDVVLRGLETARRNTENDDPEKPRAFCALLYGEPGHVCAIGYWHPE